MSVIPLIPFDQEPERITINCDELKCDQLQVNYQEFQDNQYEIKNELEVKIEGIVQERVKSIMDEILNRVAKDVVQE